jgi:maltooligosyltrehalose trehalohydrolase
MLFMGEEWGSRRPFPFFCDFKGGLADAVREGRRREYDWAYARYGDQVPDPLDEATFRSAVLDWSERDTAAAQHRLALVRGLLAVRTREIAPRLAGAAFGEAEASKDGLLTAHWRMGDGTHLRLTANLSAQPIAVPSREPSGAPIWGEIAGGHVAPWSVCWRIGA